MEELVYVKQFTGQLVCNYHTLVKQLILFDETPDTIKIIPFKYCLKIDKKCNPAAVKLVYLRIRLFEENNLFSYVLSQYTPAIDIWSIGCIFAELLTGKPLFPGKNIVHQLDLMTDLLGTPPPETIARVCPPPLSLSLSYTHAVTEFQFLAIQYT